MRFLLLILVINLSSNLSFGQSNSLVNEVLQIKNDLYRGSVKSVARNKRSRYSDNIEASYTFELKSLTVFNRYGLRTETKAWNEDNTLRIHGKIIYDETDSVFLRRKKIYPKPTGLPPEYPFGVPKWVSATLKLRVDTVNHRIMGSMKYSKDEIRQELKNFGADTNIVTRIDLYDSLGNRTSKEVMNYGMHTLERWQYVYDNRGNVLEEKTLGAEDKIIYHQIYTYDSLNRKIRDQLLSPYTNYDESFKYNKYGDLIHHEIKDTSGEEYTIGNMYTIQKETGRTKLAIGMEKMYVENFG